MTNLAIIVSNMNLLIQDGIITADEEIHTYSHWKSLGFRVKRVNML